MTAFDIKKGWYKNIDGDGLETMMQQIFGCVKKDGNVLVSKYGVLARIEAEIMSKEELRVDTVNAEGAMDDAAILDTKRKLNEFLEKSTGFDVKARKKRAQDKAKKGTL